MTEESSNRVVLVGLDGATFSILDPLMNDGTMPFLSEFVARGVRGVLRSTPHPLTPQAWTSLMTGRTPGNHGVFDFVRAELEGDHPGYSLVTSSDVRCETIWSIASRQSRRVTVLNFPCMFPPPQIRGGFVVPGFVPWSYLRRAVYPSDLYSRLQAQPGFNARELAIDWDTERKALQGLPEEEFDAWIRFHTAREQQWFEMVRFLMREEPCDLTAILFDGVDKLQHLCYHLIDPHTASRAATSAWTRQIRDLCLGYFRQLDRFIAELSIMAGPQARMFITSDHGFTLAGNRIFYANVWLAEHGYLAWKNDVPLDHEGRLTLEGFTETGTLFDWDRTTAFALTPSSNAIFIRQAKSRGRPGVSPETYAGFRNRLVAGLLAIRDVDGQPVVDRVLTREGTFPGSQSDKAPDLTLALRDHSFLSVLRADAPLKPRRMPYGTHHPDGIFFGRGPGIRRGLEVAPLSILQVAPTLLYSLGLPVPSDMEAMPALEVFEPSFVEGHPLRIDEGGTLPSPADRRDEPPLLEAGLDAQVLERLKALGYLE